MPLELTRRELLFAAACWTEILSAQEHQPKLLYFDPAAAAEITALAGQIIPEDETPGAITAGVIWFIDRSLAGYDQDQRQLYATGLAGTQKKRAELFPASTSIAGLTPAQQIELLRAIEKTDFFRQLRFHTVLGFFGHPMHGGNRDYVGWKLIGLEHRMLYHPPFGFYDAELAVDHPQ